MSIGYKRDSTCKIGCIQMLVLKTACENRTHNTACCLKTRVLQGQITAYTVQQTIRTMYCHIHAITMTYLL